MKKIILNVLLVSVVGAFLVSCSNADSSSSFLAPDVIGGVTDGFIDSTVDGVDDTPPLASVSVSLENVTNVIDNSTLELDGARDVAIAEVGGVPHFFTVAFEDDGISAFRVSDDGGLFNTDNIDDGDIRSPRAVVAAQVGGTTYAYVGTVLGVRGFRVENDGNLVSGFDFRANSVSGGYRVSDIITRRVGENNYLFVTGGKGLVAPEAHSQGVTVLRIEDDGSLSYTHNVDEGAGNLLDGAARLTAAEVDGSTYLFVAGERANGVSAFSVSDSGILSNVTNISDTSQLELSGVYDVTTAEVGGVTYLFTAGLYDNGVSVFRVSSDGGLVNVYNVDDASDSDLELGGAFTLTTAEIAGSTYLFVGALIDNGVSVFRVISDGSLLNVHNIDVVSNAGLDQVTGVTIAQVNGLDYLFISAKENDSVSVFRIEYSY